MGLTREICKRCGRENPLGFTVPDEVWLKAVPLKYQDVTLCILCFDELATYAGVNWTETPVEFWPVSGIEALKNEIEAYGLRWVEKGELNV